MKLKEFSFDLPEHLIARFPSVKRDDSKLMMVKRDSGEISHHEFKHITHLITEKDFLVINNTKVIPVRLFGTINGKRVEMLLINPDEQAYEIEAYTLPAKKFKVSTKVVLEETIFAEVIGSGKMGKRKLRFNKPLRRVLNAGYAPLPPYIKRKYGEAKQYKEYDLNRYQTVYSKRAGSIAAPTAGLHFTPGILKTIKRTSQIIEITLRVGEATFQKIGVDDISQHRMGREYITIGLRERKMIRELRKSKSLVAVGTTSVRSLETYASLNPVQESFFSELFIYPGYQFKMVDKLITNFHLPESSLFILTAAFTGLELIKKAYRIAIDKNYRFFSYGDAMLII
jgi:S-adenosylmethionine:tRNA ribosyltransferase-isomerase